MSPAKTPRRQGDGPKPVIPSECEEILRLRLRTLQGFLPESIPSKAEGVRNDNSSFFTRLAPLWPSSGQAWRDEFS